MKRPLLIIFCALLGSSCFAVDQATKRSSQPETNQAPTKQSQFSPQMQTIVYENHQYQAIAFKLNNKTTQWKLSHSLEPKRIEDWADELGANLVVNGGFFTESFEPTGLFRLEGMTLSESTYTSATVGSIQIRDGSLTLVNTSQLPSAGDLFQSYPLLIRPDGGIAVEADTEKIARRTILAQDTQDFTYVILFDGTPLSLYTASIILPRMFPELVWALNLDGGPSTGATYESENGRKHILPAIELPIVLSAKMVSPALPSGQ